MNNKLKIRVIGTDKILYDGEMKTIQTFDNVAEWIGLENNKLTLTVTENTKIVFQYDYIIVADKESEF